MATFATSQEWLLQSNLLLEARPQTTKITCRYSVKPKPARRVKGAPKQKKTAAGSDAAAATAAPPRAKLVLKTADPVSGACLKYETTKAAEVSRLVQLLGQLSRRQAGLVTAAAATTATAAVAEDVAMEDAPGAAGGSGGSASVAAPATAAPAPAQQPPPTAQQQQQGGGGGKGKKKKGKR